jgi:hypothetical protein
MAEDRCLDDQDAARRRLRAASTAAADGAQERAQRPRAAIRAVWRTIRRHHRRRRTIRFVGPPSSLAARCISAVCVSESQWTSARSRDAERISA